MNYTTSHLFSANGIAKPYAPVMVIKKFDDSNVYEVIQQKRLHISSSFGLNYEILEH